MYCVCCVSFATSSIMLPQCFVVVNNFFILFLKLFSHSHLICDSHDIISCFQLFVNRFLIFLTEKEGFEPSRRFHDLHPFQGCPFGQLGYFSTKLLYLKTSCCILFDTEKEFLRILFNRLHCRTERVGFEPTRPCGQTDFKTASL